MTMQNGTTNSLQQGDWLQSESLLYRLYTVDGQLQNYDEIDVTMANGSRNMAVRTDRARQLRAALTHPPGDSERLRELLLRTAASERELADALIGRCKPLTRERHLRFSTLLNEAAAALAQRGSAVQCTVGMNPKVKGLGAYPISRTIMELEPMNDELLKEIAALTSKSVAAEKPGDAMQFAQAALNLAHTHATLAHTHATLKNVEKTA